MQFRTKSDEIFIGRVIQGGLVETAIYLTAINMHPLYPVTSFPVKGLAFKKKKKKSRNVSVILERYSPRWRG